MGIAQNLVSVLRHRNEALFGLSLYAHGPEAEPRCLGADLVPAVLVAQMPVVFFDHPGPDVAELVCQDGQLHARFQSDGGVGVPEAVERKSRLQSRFGGGLVHVPLLVCLAPGTAVLLQEDEFGGRATGDHRLEELDTFVCQEGDPPLLVVRQALDPNEAVDGIEVAHAKTGEFTVASTAVECPLDQFPEIRWAATHESFLLFD